MESLYFVLSWLCHRKCPHCYEDRFRPYHGAELGQIAGQAEANVPRIIENFPRRLTYRDPLDGFREKPGRVILAGGEVLLDAIREPVLYPAIEQLRSRYHDQGGVRVIIQTTGDILTERILHQLLDRRVWLVSISGMDAYHEGFEDESRRARQVEKLRGWFQAAAMRECGGDSAHWQDPGATGPYYHFFGATPDSWIGKLWPRGRAWANELSTAAIGDNFCNQWSGGLGFLDTAHRGSEVSIDPEGNVYPCCVKTGRPVGNILNNELDDVLGSARGNPVWEAISMGHPERMGIARGWTVERFYEESRATLPSGREYRNLCVGCDRFFEKETELVKIAC